MSRSIKSLKKLHSLIGQTVHVVGTEGHEFDAVVEDGRDHHCIGKYAVTLVTTDKAADSEDYWWQGSTRPLAGVCAKAWGHHVTEPSQLTVELRSVTTFKAKEETSKPAKKKLTCKKKRKATKYISCEKINENIGKYCRLADGQIAFIAGKNDHARLCFTERSNGCGWSLDIDEDVDKKYRPFVVDYNRGWCVVDDWDAEQIQVVEILEAKPSTEKLVEEVKTTKTILDMTVREVLEKLHEIIISR